MRSGSLALALFMLGCSAEPESAPAPAPRADPIASPESQHPPPVEVIEPAPAEPEPKPAPPTNFDPLRVAEIDARIVGLHATKSWHACGISHSVGAVEVEVLLAGEPRPRMILIVSCPADMGAREVLEIGAFVHVTLHARKQSWPAPAGKPDPSLPRRYVKKMSLSEASEPTPPGREE